MKTLLIEVPDGCTGIQVWSESGGQSYSSATFSISSVGNMDGAERKAKALLKVLRAAKELRSWGQGEDDVRLDYLDVQVGRGDVEELDEALKEVGELGL